MGNFGIVEQMKMILWVVVLLQLFFNTNSHNSQEETILEDELRAHKPSSGGVQLDMQNQHVILSNDLVSVTFASPSGLITNITSKGSDSLLETGNKEDNRGYWDFVWNPPGVNSSTDKLLGTNYKVILQNNEQIEISFSATWAVGSAKIPLNVDKRFVMLRDSPGFYAYGVFERLEGWPAFVIQQGRIVFKIKESKFHYMAMSDERQRIMPTAEDRVYGKVLDYPEAVLLTKPSNPDLIGEVDDKYFYSCNNEDNVVHGWVSNDPVPVGFWMITPSNEFRNGGPLKQDLTSHVGSTVLSMFFSTHYAGEDLALKFQANEHWKKVFGPVFVYLNSDVSAKTDPSVLWNDAKKRMQLETTNWPYNFPLSSDFLKSNQRGAVSGQLFVYDRFINKNALPGKLAYVGLALPGDAGSWQTESKGYQFWTEADVNGNFVIKNVIPGTYNLFAWVPGYVGNYKYGSELKVTSGSNMKLTNVVFNPPRNGPTFWEIGIPDRTAAEFFIPDPSPMYKMHQYKTPIEKFRQYGLWLRFTDIFGSSGKRTLVYTVGQSDYRKDWFFAHVNRRLGPKAYQAETWQIMFDLKTINKAANYTLQLALASASEASLQVRVNPAFAEASLFTTNLIGRDNAVARHGIHGLYHFYSIAVPGSRLVDGKNVVMLTQAISGGPFREIMYDYIRFEGPSV